MERNLTEGNILKNIIYFSLPYFLAYFLQTLYGMADLYIIGQFNETADITAVSVGSQAMHMHIPATEFLTCLKGLWAGDMATRRLLGNIKLKRANNLEKSFLLLPNPKLFLARRLLLYKENPTLCVGFKKAYSGEQKKNLLMI